MKCHHPSIIFKSDVPKFGRGDEEGGSVKGRGKRKVGLEDTETGLHFKNSHFRILYILIIDNLSSYYYYSFVSVCFMVVC